jgi:Lrp/AsnC family leucine-responsive transcriptional regulator
MTVQNAVLDKVDRDILDLLQRDARMSYRELGEHVSLSANATADRVRRLRESGVIVGFRAVVDAAAAGRALVALIDVRLSGPGETERFEQLVASLEAITAADHVTGRFDYALRVSCRDTTDLDGLIRTLKTKGGVIATDTRIALRNVVGRAEAAQSSNSA